MDYGRRGALGEAYEVINVDINWGKGARGLLVVVGMVQ
jgi:hypothetical protein